MEQLVYANVDIHRVSFIVSWVSVKKNFGTFSWHLHCIKMTIICWHFTGQYPEPFNRTCTSCLSPCKQCNPLDPNKCISCPSGKFLYNHQCISGDHCPVGTYANTTTETCEDCPVGCTSCSSSSDLQCLTCSNGFVLYDTSCITRCPEGTFPQHSNRLGFTSKSKYPNQLLHLNSASCQ